MLNWRYFTEQELACKHTGRCKMDPAFMGRLVALREAVNKPLVITSGYRDPSHPVEAKKPRGGAHTMGRAVDIAATHGFALDLIRKALALGFTGYGIATTYIHLDDLPEGGVPVRPALWTYGA